MRISYDPKYDIMYLKFIDGKVADTIEVEANILIDYGERGEVGHGDRDHKCFRLDESQSSG